LFLDFPMVLYLLPVSNFVESCFDPLRILEAAGINFRHQRQMVRGDAGEWRDVGLTLVSAAHGLKRDREREQRRTGPKAWRLAEFLIQTENRPAEGKPFVEIE
jgi:hypothetical protein